MSSTLSYDIRKPRGNFSDDLKWKLEKRYDLPTTLSDSDIPYIQGLVDCGVKDADKLIKLIERHEFIDIKLTY